MKPVKDKEKEELQLRVDALSDSILTYEKMLRHKETEIKHLKYRLNQKIRRVYIKGN